MWNPPTRSLLAVALLALAAPAARGDEYRWEPAALPAPFFDRDRVDARIEASGVEPIGDGRLLVEHDKDPALFVVDAATGRFVGAPITSPKFPAGGDSGPKWEGMTHDSAGNIYLVGAHSGKTDAERAAKAWLVRFRLKDSKSPAIDDASVVRWRIAGPLEAALRAEGLDEARVAKRKIEGLAIRERAGADGTTRRELVVGLREPGDKVRAFAADITAAEPDAELELRPAFSFAAGPREGVESQLTSLEHVAALGGFLVVTATEDASNVFHGNTLWFVPDDAPGRPRQVATFEVAMKAEGLAVLGVETSDRRVAVRLLITFDNDPHATKIPSRFQAATLVRESH
jgi:hypothetical protein